MIVDSLLMAIAYNICGIINCEEIQVMPTRADFYSVSDFDVELKPEDWLGSIAFDGYIQGIPCEILEATREIIYLNSLDTFLKYRDDGTSPDQGWPWRWDDSTITDCNYLYCKDKDRVYTEFNSHWVSCSYLLSQIKENPDNWWDSPVPENSPKVFFPDMKKLRNITLGWRSGLIVFQT